MGRGLAENTRSIIGRALELWEEVYGPADIVPTVRQLFYALAVEGFVPKSEKGYGKVQTTLAMARERGLYPWEGIYDGLRIVNRPDTWGSLDEFTEAVKTSYRLDPWQFQPEPVEVWLEKDTIRGTVQAVIDEYRVPLLIGRGYLSVTAKKAASERIKAGPRTVLYIGDHDPSGINMEEEAESWICDEAMGGLSIERVAITDEDHADPALPHLPVNTNDTRTEKYVERYGGEVVEVEALPPKELQARLKIALGDTILADKWAETMEREEEEISELEDRLS